MLLKAARWSRTRGRQQAGAVSLTSFMQPCKEHGAARLFAAVEGQLARSTALLFAPALQNKLASSKMYFCPPPILILPVVSSPCRRQAFICGVQEVMVDEVFHIGAVGWAARKPRR